MSGTSEVAGELLSELHAQVEALVTSDDWKRALDVAQRFHRYSFGNVLLIGMQRPDATLVAGYRKWNEFGRHVRNGERSIRILAPLVVKKRDAATDDERPLLIGFKGVGVFDVSQTDGEPIPERPKPRLLDGEAPEGALDAIAGLIQAAGFAFERGDCGAANGYTDFASKAVRVRADVADAQALKTAIHELAHVSADAPENGDRFTCQGAREVRAESVAYVVAGALGLPTDDYSFAYVGSWADGSVGTVQATGEQVLRLANEILVAVEATA